MQAPRAWIEWGLLWEKDRINSSWQDATIKTAEIRCTVVLVNSETAIRRVNHRIQAIPLKMFLFSSLPISHTVFFFTIANKHFSALGFVVRIV